MVKCTTTKYGFICYNFFAGGKRFHLKMLKIFELVLFFTEITNKMASISTIRKLPATVYSVCIRFRMTNEFESYINFGLSIGQ